MCGEKMQLFALSTFKILFVSVPLTIRNVNVRYNYYYSNLILLEKYLVEFEKENVLKMSI